ncbi:methylthioadenosine nucleosidase /adenosylhomocysteine nucleosidase [Polaromonas sp. OV174]|uniref:5'-methylthioadenosine/adenosylhomocysteine nucleosidase n=1 Tax=Polaromonas sp. OV174 TaxID=1855300 RepID=UPI0008E653B4|nr:5'-methylthioadenosine/adenosylhomocysteine nucleosidase [Polaromonas sp. OV174]SFC21213.1 methylthioadenosine nucleosidase /adenosylhomocysteine nucleosidase [Polaromonas sp. OV174]
MSFHLQPATAPTAILSALAQEQHGLIDLLQQPRKLSHAGRDFWLGELHGQPVVLALSKIGKVAAATTATALIERLGVQRIVFTGVAGGLGEGVSVGDVVVATDFVQHDLDASPLFPRYEVPLYGRTRFQADAALTALLFKAACAALASEPSGGQEAGAVQSFPGARVHQGLIASGDRFVSGAEESRVLRDALMAAGHPVLAVEMEGAAVAQVCQDYGLPFAAVRTISDRADDSAHIDFPRFVDEVASRYARLMVEQFLKTL